MRKGFFEISDELYTKHWDIFSLIFKDFRPIHIEFNYWNKSVWTIVGISDKFDEVEEDEPTPQYEVVFTRHQYDQYTYVFKRV